MEVRSSFTVLFGLLLLLCIVISSSPLVSIHTVDSSTDSDFFEDFEEEDFEEEDFEEEDFEEEDFEEEDFEEEDFEEEDFEEEDFEEEDFEEENSIQICCTW